MKMNSFSSRSYIGKQKIEQEKLLTCRHIKRVEIHKAS